MLWEGYLSGRLSFVNLISSIEPVKWLIQALTDFMVECTIDNQEIGGQEVVAQEGKETCKQEEEMILKYY